MQGQLQEQDNSLRNRPQGQAAKRFWTEVGRCCQVAQVSSCDPLDDTG